MALAASEDPPNGPTWIHFVALHFSPLVVGQLPCRLVLSVSPFGVKLRTRPHLSCMTIDESQHSHQAIACSPLCLTRCRCTSAHDTGTETVTSHKKPSGRLSPLSKRSRLRLLARTCRTAERPPCEPSQLRRPSRTQTTAGQSPCLPPGGTLSLHLLRRGPVQKQITHCWAANILPTLLHASNTRQT